jgi:two-component system phosphate regulon sensor histidine kinase PhoR
MQGAQTTILNSPEESRRAFEPPYEAADLISVAFARYPYPEFFFGWSPAARGTVIFARSDRMPTWLPERRGADVYPVEVVLDPPQVAALRRRIERDVAVRRRHSTFDLTIAGVPYQVIALLSYDSVARERLDRVFGLAVNLDWVRNHYFRAIVQEVARVAGNTGAVTFVVTDERGHRVGGEPNAELQLPTTRHFPLFFFDPTIVAIDTPADLVQRRWTITASAAGDPTFALAVRGARRTLVALAAGVVLLAVSLLATARAVRANAALASVRADFVATVTHELKTPLSTIRAVGETIARGRVKTEQDLKRYAGLLVREERRLTRLVNNLLAYSRVTDVTEVYSFEAHDPGALIKEATQGFRRQLADSGFSLDVSVPPDIPAVKADRTAIVLALDNLIDNAIRYSGDATSVAIQASASNGEVRFEIIDRGVGIPEDELPAVRRRFVRGRTAPGDGNGLGLAIVSRIAEDHNGALHIRSQVGSGTTVSLCIPSAGA